MAVLQDPVILAQYRSPLANWNVSGYIVWKETARAWLLANLGEGDERKINKLLFEHVQGGGLIDQVPERRAEWDDYDNHYDLRLALAGRLIYVETVLEVDDPQDAILRVVSIHDA